MSKDPDLNRDVQNELNQIFPEMNEREYYYPAFAGTLRGAIENSLNEGVFHPRCALVLRDSLQAMTQEYPGHCNGHQDLIFKLNAYIEKHDKTAH